MTISRIASPRLLCLYCLPQAEAWGFVTITALRAVLYWSVLAGDGLDAAVGVVGEFAYL